MIAITGATGQLGRLVINSLLEKTEASQIVALARSLDKAEDLKALGLTLRQADYEQPDSFVSGLAGVNKVLLISSNTVGSRAAHHQAVIDAAKLVGVDLFAYTSILKADTNPMMLAEEHKLTESTIQAAGLPAVILRNGWYTENYTASLGGVLQAGAVAGAAEDGKFYAAARQDFAEAAAVVLSSENQVGQVYELAGDEGFTLTEYAAEVSKQSGKTIPYQNMSGDAFAQLLTQIGLPAGFATMLADSEAQAAKGWLTEDSKTLSKLIGRPTTPFAETIKEALASMA